MLSSSTISSSFELEMRREFYHLFAENQKSIYSYILMQVHQIDTADDIFQDVALAMWQHFDDYETGTSFKSWGICIARNKVVDYIRKNKNKQKWFSENIIQLISDNMSRKYDDKRVKALESCLAKLSENDRRLVKMKYSQRITTKALSEQIGRPVNGLYKSLARIHTILYKCIKRELEKE